MGRNEGIQDHMEAEKLTPKNRPGDGTPGPGRPKGVPNKNTMAAREAYRVAFEELGGAQGLADWAKLNQTDFYKLHSRLIPVDIIATHGLSDPLQDLLESIANNGRPRPGS